MNDQRSVSMREAIEALLRGQGIGSIGLFNGTGLSGVDPDHIAANIARLYIAAIAPAVLGRLDRVRSFVDDSDRLASQAARQYAAAAGTLTPSGAEAWGAARYRRSLADALAAGRRSAAVFAGQGYGKSVSDAARLQAMNDARSQGAALRASYDPSSSMLQGASLLGQAGSFLNQQAFGPLEGSLFSAAGGLDPRHQRERGKSFLGHLLDIGSIVLPRIFR
jgi:hypothetical protein